MTATLSTRNASAIAARLANRESFKTHGALAGYAPGAGVSTCPGRRLVPRRFGRLPVDWHRTLTARQHVVDYIIWSYATPIAWHDSQVGWVVPDVRYSVTTSNHQGKVRHAIRLAGETYAE